MEIENALSWDPSVIGDPKTVTFLQMEVEEEARLL
jgi:hypothetical protein